jgi:hypothetical protein
MEKLHIEKVPTLAKNASTNIGNDPKRWSGEILSSLVSDHPYIDTTQVKIKFTRLDPDTTKNAYGVVIIANKATIPFSIRKNDVDGSYELDPLDIIFDGKKLSHLNEVSLNNVLVSSNSKTLVDKKDLPGSNPYVGDITGDVTPLEWSGTGSRSVIASVGLLNSVIKNQSSIQRMAYLLSSYRGLNSALEYSGLKDSLASVLSSAQHVITDQTKTNMVHLVLDNKGDVAVIFSNGDTRYVDIEDLRDALMDDFEYVASGLNKRGWAIVRDFPMIRDSHIVDGSPIPEVIEIGGRYSVMSMSGPVECLVSTQKNYFDGTNVLDQLAISLAENCNNRYMQGQKLVGKPSTPMPDSPRLGLKRYADDSLVTRSSSRTSNLAAYNFPVGVIDVGVTGCFIENSFGSPKHTPIFTIKKMIELPNEKPMLIVTSPAHSGDIAFITVPGLIRPQVVPRSHYQAMDGILPDVRFYIPEAYVFVSLGERLIPIDKSIVEMSMHEPVIVLSKNANRYSMFGNSKNESIQEERLSKNDMITKLASLGACDNSIEFACDMANNSSANFVNLGIEEVSINKVASRNLTNIKLAAEEIIQGVDEAAQANPESFSDPSLLSALLSMQFINDDTIDEIIDDGNSFMFDQCEDKIAKMLLASRQGKIMIDNRAIEKALKGIGSVRMAIRMLKLKDD